MGQRRHRSPGLFKVDLLGLIAIGASLVVNFAIELFDVTMPYNIHASTISLLTSLALFFGISLASTPPRLDPDIEAVMDI